MFNLNNLTGKKFKELDFKWTIFTEQPQKSVNVINFQKKFNGVAKKYFDKYITTALCEEFLLALDNIFAENADMLKENNANEVLSKACKIKDKLYTIYDVLANGTPHEEAGKLSIAVAKQRRSAATRLFEARCKSVKDFDEWFKALMELRTEMQELYRVTDYSQADISKWNTPVWTLHTGFLMLCRNTDEDVEHYARDYWDYVMEDLEEINPTHGYGLDFINNHPIDVIYHICDAEADKDYVMRCLNLDETIN